ncbi:MAG: helix-hairpin-helix domain-containing protein [Bacteroidetes bacterium]|nr:helix-hairpin-helix domain-containing protein [Bacteroidota bacterium]
MKRITAWVRNFFGFSRKETNAFLILLPLMFIVIFSEPAYRYWFVRQPQNFAKESKSLDSLMATLNWQTNDSLSKMLHDTKLFLFDPNTATQEQFVQLGFSASLSARVINYRAKGGRFVIKRDLMKIYGMDSVHYAQLIPFINLPEIKSKNKITQKTEKRPEHKLEKFDLNTADTSQLIKVYGIGSKLSARIVAHREKLGGFISISQLKEIYGLDSAVLKELNVHYFVQSDFQPRQININTATAKELGDHPYIKYKVANLIVAYRLQHGKFESVEDIIKIKIIKPEQLAKMKPYLTI